MTSSPNLDQMTPEQLRGLAEQAAVAVPGRLHEPENPTPRNGQRATGSQIAILKRHKFAKRSEQLSPTKAVCLMICSIPISQLSKPS
jgi:hypothetical protein